MEEAMDNPMVQFIERTTHHIVHGPVRGVNHGAHGGGSHGRLDAVHCLSHGRHHGVL